MNEPDILTDLGPIERIAVMENHDGAYRAWRDAGVSQRILVHIDAHHDMWRVRPGHRITIANFISPALAEGLVREAYWVVPDETWNTAKTRRPILRHLRAIAKSYEEPDRGVQAGEGPISTVVLGKSIRVLPLSHLPRIDESVLLDIDIDYLVIPRVSHGISDLQGPVPWCWPDDLLARLAACHLRTDLATIVYSVEGGYTPLKWKYLGDELELRLKRADPHEPALVGMTLMKEAALAAHRGDLSTAEVRYQKARVLLPTSAAPCYHLAHLYLDAGRTEDARLLYHQALLQDPSYRTPYNNFGVRYLSERRLKDAEQEYRRTIALDPQDAQALCGLGRVAARRKRWSEAESLLQQALSLDSNLPDAWRILGEVLSRQSRFDEAIRAYERSLKLVLKGHKPLAAPIKTQEDIDPLADPYHFEVQARVARLYAAIGEREKAIAGYRFSIGGRQDGPLIRWRLASLYLRENQWRNATSEAWQGVMKVPIEVARAVRRAFRRAWRTLVRRWEALL